MSGRRLKVLVCNDDGYDTSGIRLLARAVSGFADTHICAPLRNHSGASSALTISSRPDITRQEGVTIVHGTPVDCIHHALFRDDILPWKPDLTLSGINNGGNLGDDTIYSGTVSAAAESVIIGVPAMAFSLACVPEYNFPPTHFKEAAEIAGRLVERLAGEVIASGDTVLNVNIPDLPAGEIGEERVCVLGRRHPERPVSEVGRKDDLGLRRYELGINHTSREGDEMTDFETIEAGHVAVTPLSFDMTEHGRMEEVAGWMDGIAAAGGQGG